MSVVVSDTSPIRALAHLNLASLLRDLYGEVLIPPEVARELARTDSSLPSLKWSDIPGVRLQHPQDTARIDELAQFLDRGESEAIVLALEVNAKAILVDERAARSVAASMGLAVIGALGTLSRAKEKGLIAAVTPLMDELIEELDFRVSESLYREVQQTAGETDD